MKKVWTVKNKGVFSDEELIDAIKNGIVVTDDLLTSDILDAHIKVSDSIYQFYLEGNGYETI